MPHGFFPQWTPFHKYAFLYEKNKKLLSLRTSSKQPGEYDAYFHMHHFHSSRSPSREETAKQDHASKHLYLVPLFEFHDTRHFVEFVLNFKVPYSKGFPKWGSRASCSMLVNSTTPIRLNKDDKLPKEVKEITIICRKAVDVPFQLTPSSFTSTPVFVMLLQQNVMGQIADGPYINQA